MYKITLRCACGRTMTPDGRAGHGAFRCGCGRDGVHVIEQIDKVRRCSYDGCRTLATTKEPLRFCVEHEMDAATRLGHLAGTQVLEHFLNRSQSTRSRRFGMTIAPVKPTKHAPVVYFAVPPTHLCPEGAGGPPPIKIGTSTDLRDRMKAIPARPLALEPGDQVRERQLHRQFGHLRLEGEWFRAAPELIEYINELREADGVPRLKWFDRAPVASR
ncbi:GIY-YIG nuclease family protein [Streptomyces griseofuscus]|uniref:GIY-YIG nuclease family protein n=1 Tax=Streptomyces griseofuscus TaxID=146922 RepID=UPI000F654012|nr:GIY-YIG nuclease family protein [Streptomyces griseofuscus]